MTNLIVLLLFIIYVCLAGYGFSLFVIESPYIQPIVKKIESVQVPAKLESLKSVIIKGMNCYTCTSFWGSLLASYALIKYALIPWLAAPNFLEPCTWILMFMMACMGSGFSTGASYLMSAFLDWHKLNFKDEGNESGNTK